MGKRVDDILKANFIESCKLIQRSYFAGFVTATAFLGLVLQAKSKSGSHEYTIPILNVSIGHSMVAAVYLTLFVYAAVGAIMFLAEHKYAQIKSMLSDDDMVILKTYPSIGCSNIAIKIFTTLMLVLYVTIIFESINPIFSFFYSFTSASMMSAFYIIALFSSKPKLKRKKVTKSI